MTRPSMSAGGSSDIPPIPPQYRFHLAKAIKARHLVAHWPRGVILCPSEAHWPFTCSIHPLFLKGRFHLGQHHFLLPPAPSITRTESSMKISELYPPPLLQHSPSPAVMTIDRALFTLLPTEAERIIIRGKLEAAVAIPLLAEKTRLEEVIPVYKSLLSSLCLLPTNILSMIFIEIVGTAVGFLDDHSNRAHTLDTKYGAFGLGQVCRQWRQVALDMPQLWSSIVIRPTAEYRVQCPIKLAERNLALCITRARERQLHLALTIPSAWWHSTLFAQLAAHSDQWASLYVFIHQLRFEGEALNQLRAQLCSLKRLSIRFLDPTEAFGYLDAFESIPPLSHLCLRNINIVRNSMVFPWRQLTRFHIEDIRSGDFSGMLRDLERMTSLQDLVIDSIETPPPSTIFALPSNLTLDAKPGEELDLCMRDLIERSHCDLKSLTLSGKTFGENIDAAMTLISPFTLLTKLVWLCPSTDIWTYQRFFDASRSFIMNSTPGNPISISNHSYSRCPGSAKRIS
ncbi:hypothetical protein C8J56DRAFT_1103641 [Mycena floridula]|nr:hypothetical protein C8J56DRAFT_1124991 [Mycena floridula]KAJ7580582.1 hypothetical protein C8J56DRAFT_1103641 [Mycena floridula]